MEYLTRKMKPEYGKLLNGEPESDEEFMAPPSSSPTRRAMRWRQRFYVLLVSLVSLVIGSIGGGAYQRHYHISCDPPSLPDMDPAIFNSNPEAPRFIRPYSPAPVRYVNRFLKAGPESKPFMGHPRPELDAAWHDLLAGTLIRYSAEELHLANTTTSIRHKEGGYVGGMGVSHQLHCLKRIKQYLHPDYYPDVLNTHEDNPFEHLDHCLESLRLAILCYGDTNIYALQWRPHNRFKPGVVLSQQNVCVDWGLLHSWMRGRAARFDDMERLPDEVFDAYDREHQGGAGHHHEMGHDGMGKGEHEHMEGVAEGGSSDYEF